MNTYTTTHYVIEQSRLPIHTSLRSRAAAGIVAGCLALSVCPAIALAAEPDQGAPQGGETTMQQPMDGQLGGFGEGQPIDGDFGGGQGDGSWGESPDQGDFSGAPAFDQGFDGGMPGEQSPFGLDGPVGTQPKGESGDQAGNQPGGQWGPEASSPNQQGMAQQNDQQMQNQQPGGPMGGQPGNMMAPTSGNPPMGNPMDSQISQFIKEKFGINLEGNLPGAASGDAQNPGEQSGDGQIPELPEGLVNVQQVIDSVHDLMLKYDIQTLEGADLEDSEFMEELSEYITKANNDRLQEFASGEKPGQNGTPARANESGQSNTPGKGGPAAQSATDKEQTSSNSKTNEKANATSKSSSKETDAADATQKSSSTKTNAQASKDAAPNEKTSQLSESFLTKIVNFISGVFGYKA